MNQEQMKQLIVNQVNYAKGAWITTDSFQLPKKYRVLKVKEWLSMKDVPMTDKGIDAEALLTQLLLQNIKDEIRKIKKSMTNG